MVARALVTGGLPKILHARPTPAALARFANYSLPPTRSILFSGLGFFLRKPSCGPVTISPPPPAGAQAPQKPRARARATTRARTGRVERVPSGRKGSGYACACLCYRRTMYVRMYVCVYGVCMCVCLYVCMYACMCACVLLAIKTAVYECVLKIYFRLGVALPPASRQGLTSLRAPTAPLGQPYCST